MPTPRYLPDMVWPAYAYRPGREPHPTRDPRGHSRDLPSDDRPAEAPSKWATSMRYLRGVDLFNHGYGWEAHEVWESLWMRPRNTAQAEWLQALIQLAAATVQESVGRGDGRMRLCHRALGHIHRVRREGHVEYMGLSLGPLERAIELYAGDAGQRPVLILHPDPREEPATTTE